MFDGSCQLRILVALHILGLLASPLAAATADDQLQQCGCPAGNVSDCCCTFMELEDSNTRVVHGLLKRVVATPFFAHFKLNLCSKCSLWHDNPLCSLRDCAVCECEEPPAWAMDEGCGKPQVDRQLDLGVSPSIATGWPLALFPSGMEQSSDDEDVVVDLRLNPERYTGYGGESAARVWSAIHSENCFQPAQPDSAGQRKSEVCLLPREQRVYNRLLSGLHASISLHIARTYCLERNASTVGECARWGAALEVASERVLQHPDRLENLYAAFAMLLRAVVKAGPAVSAAVPKEDPEFAAGLQEWETEIFPEVQRMADACPKTFAEEELFAGPSGEALWDQVQGRLDHLAEIMKCVGCDRCKLWGTLQTLGISTALRVLFQFDSEVQLSRQEAVALVHTLERLSSSLVYVREFRQLTAEGESANLRV
mmetsp:Transcript_59421/g.173876  ORF Transcript_59421/g.173876 Transcript_59421/m.173876 type:complete len:426 (-) Transcript_59421:300-1577(-)